MRFNLISICLVLAFVTTGYASVVIGNWEGTSLDGWGPGINDSSAILVPGSTTGVTLGSGSLKFTPVADGAYWRLQWVGTPMDLSGATLKFDLTMIASEWPSTTWTQVADKIGVNSNASPGWEEYGPGSSSHAAYSVIDRDTGKPTTRSWGTWEGNAKKTFSFDISDYDSTGATWMQIAISIQDANPAGNGNFYFDNFRIIPEPATMIMLGLGGLTFLRRKK